MSIQNINDSFECLENNNANDSFSSNIELSNSYRKTKEKEANFKNIIAYLNKNINEMSDSLNEYSHRFQDKEKNKMTNFDLDRKLDKLLEKRKYSREINTHPSSDKENENNNIISCQNRKFQEVIHNLREKEADLKKIK
jgi:hypothetical protein